MKSAVCAGPQAVGISSLGRVPDSCAHPCYRLFIAVALQVNFSLLDLHVCIGVCCNHEALLFSAMIVHCVSENCQLPVRQITANFNIFQRTV